LAVLLILLLPVLTCKNFAPDSYDDPDAVTYTDVVYTPDGKSVTIYLDGTTVPITNRQSRALSRELAIAGHDYFEVAFYKAGSTPVRASWELMTDAHVNGVYRGVDYQYTSVGDADTANEGAAFLFVGKKTDKTLLGVGKLTRVNGVPGTTIGPNASTVTFEVAALKCGIDMSGCGFFTNYNNIAGGDSAVDTSNTYRDEFTIDGIKFPIFKLRESNTTNAHYIFDVSGGGIASYLDGIILAGNGSYGKKQPRYSTANGRFQYASLRLDDKTVISAVNNTVPNSYDPLTAPVAFDNTVKVSFNTANTITGSSFGFVFEIPIYPLSAANSLETWYIRASYDSYWLDLDDGNIAEHRAGGAVLIGTGNVDGPSQLRIRVVVPPAKWRYSANPSNGRDLSVTGLRVVLETRSGEFVAWLDPLTDLKYELGMKIINVGENIKDTLSGLQTIIVNYVEPGSGITYTDSFSIVCDDNTNSNRYTDIPSSHYFTASDSNELIGIASSIAGMSIGTYVIVLTGSFDIASDFGIQIGRSPSLIIMVAGSTTPPDTTPINPNIRIGRTGNATGFHVYATSNAFYFGKWPFYAPLVVGGTEYHHAEQYIINGVPINYLYASWGYTINVDGSISELSISPPYISNTHHNYARPFIYVNISNGRVYDVTVDDHVNIQPVNTTRLY